MDDLRAEHDIAIRWRRLDRKGAEEARLLGQRLTGSAQFEHEGEACVLAYVIQLSDAFETIRARVTGHVGARVIDLAIERGWTMNGEPAPAVGGCIDLDLNFSPSTNLLPIRRLSLEVGESAEVRAAWLRFPSFTLEPLVQRYTRTGERAYRYESGGGSFVAHLEVDAHGFVLHYPGFAVAE